MPPSSSSLSLRMASSLSTYFIFLFIQVLSPLTHPFVCSPCCLQISAVDYLIPYFDSLFLIDFVVSPTPFLQERELYCVSRVTLLLLIPPASCSLCPVQCSNQRVGVETGSAAAAQELVLVMPCKVNFFLSYFKGLNVSRQRAQ